MTDQAMQQLILKELRELRSSFNSHAADTSQRLDNLESQMSTLVTPSPRSKPRPVLVTAISPRVRRSRPS
jgi:hypothetical protein